MHFKFNCVIYFSAYHAVKLKVEQKGFNFSQCADIYQPLGVNLTSGMYFCAGGEEDKGSCEGDEGDLINFVSEIYRNGYLS